MDWTASSGVRVDPVKSAIGRRVVSRHRRKEQVLCDPLSCLLNLIPRQDLGAKTDLKN